ncbi:hypothetical protein E4U17_003065 [Claviceps sp. LM77 group G4]|nr:hypothetical protein E4U17_003065 [Claviceps sp. LM77 group G4]KAG6078899.1 hypothetical protein E4U33_000555 [Claviceps sp. LM78 group G4]KAG6080461.1 hypothetical protein E4U16_000308 [Claviceps sp. LM84 group G4]
MTAPTRPEQTHGTLTTDRDILHEQLKKHRVLPLSRHDRTANTGNRAASATFDAAVDTSASRGSTIFQTSSPRPLKHKPRRIGTGPDLPPTPPNYGRIYSGGNSAHPPSPISQGPGFQTLQASSRRAPATPPEHRYPPTPDVTPPQAETRSQVLRSLNTDCGFPRTITATELRTRSFFNVGKNPGLSEDEAVAHAGRNLLAPSISSHTNVLRLPISSRVSQLLHTQALKSALESLTGNEGEKYKLRSRGEQVQFDNGWESSRNANLGWDADFHQGMVSGGSRKISFVTTTSQKLNGARDEALEDQLFTSETDRSVLLEEFNYVEPSPKSSTLTHLKSQRRSTGPISSRSELGSSTNSRRSAGLSSTPISSAVIEATLVDNTSLLQTQRTLRHVRKRRELRDSSPHGRKSTAVDENSPSLKKLSTAKRSLVSGSRLEHASATGFDAAASGRPRKEVWKAGDIPVVVIPGRTSSQKSKPRERPLRSSSSRRSRTRSLESSSSDQSPLPRRSGEVSFNHKMRRGRSTSVSARLEQRTMDSPPSIPPRSSSLSAPTSRTTSRAGSLTVKSMRAGNEIHRQEVRSTARESAPVAAVNIATSPVSSSQRVPQPKETVAVSRIAASQTSSKQSPLTPQSEWDKGHDSFDADADDALGKDHSFRTTKFSLISTDTNGTAPEISEAQAVRLYRHKNTSVMRINHSVKPKGMEHKKNSDVEYRQLDSQGALHDAAKRSRREFTTPEEKRGEEMESSVRNSRSPTCAPVCPPEINFIPATPSGLTPSEERQVQLGNFYDITAETPVRRPSIVRRALGRPRRHSVSYPPTQSKQPGFLARTLSWSRDSRKSLDTRRQRSLSQGMEPNYGNGDDPLDQNKLHPYWRPQWNDANYCDCKSCRCGSEGDEEEFYRYPPVDNRPRARKRSLSAKVKKTFAILPVRQDYQCYMDDDFGPERCTIRRTPSGNLKVMRRRSSDYSLRQHTMRLEKKVSQKEFWVGHGLRRRRSIIGLSSGFERMPSLRKRWNEKRRAKRIQKLRQMISRPKEVRDEVGEVVRFENMGAQRAD